MPRAILSVSDKRGLVDFTRGLAELGWEQPWYLTSAIGREGTWPIMLEVQAFLDRRREEELEARNAGEAPEAG